MALSSRPTIAETKPCTAPMSPTRKSCTAKLRFLRRRGDCWRNLPSTPHTVEIGGRRGLQFASAPVLVRECGLTAENVCKRALALLEKNNARFADSAAKDAETH